MEENILEIDPNKYEQFIFDKGAKKQINKEKLVLFFNKWCWTN